MEIIPVYCEKCKRYYDKSKYIKCPNCLKTTTQLSGRSYKSDDNATEVVKQGQANDQNATEVVRQSQVSDENATEAVRQSQGSDENATEVVRQGQKSDKNATAVVRQRQSSDENETEVVRQSQRSDENETEAVRQNQSSDQNATETVSRTQEDVGETIAINMYQDLGEVNISPVVGWLIAIDGQDEGRDYRLVAGKNFIGRSSDNHVCLANDRAVSRKNHATVLYDPRNKKYYLVDGDNKSVVYVNNAPLLQNVELSAYDVIEIGQTRLLFMPLCSERFNWEVEQ